ncbi:Stealth CR1 domain-containing protein [Roseicitreum antarcticum]|uniref:Stealth protein CR1, conserved region 1 n=1 Tax=Roseicitreum antarcticum TaxID=564137 RepID=A0A1H2SJJ0_9RHOB|nr:Stealth CR1 domain-containing protein [Roseicitreum antarcticum]SDW31294.1 Stealth protein CR1, conserved region 1 [Roseicitreum antarcticum]
MIPPSEAPGTDAVITWVDGADPLHLARRHAAQATTATPLHENAINAHRWGSGDELAYCLRSIANHAPWLRRIWIVTDRQTPDLSALPHSFREKIAIIDHSEVFAGLTDALPTFNSLSIETMLWRIPGLSEQFVYFNDDVFLTARLDPSDLFRDGMPVLRGKWVDYSVIAADPAARADPALLHHFVQINAARLIGYDAAHLFNSAHVVHPARRSVMADLYRQMPDTFHANIAHRFRDLSQFFPSGLHNHACIRAGACHLHTDADHLHLRTGAVIDYPLDQVRAYLRRATLPTSKFLCINDLPQLEAAIPDTRDWIERAISA